VAEENKIRYQHIIRSKDQGSPVLQQNLFHTKCGEALEYLTFPSLEETGVVRHLFTTRMGGVSSGEFSTLNLSFERGDEKDRVLENYRRIAEVLDCNVEDMVASHQTHATNIRRVDATDGGKGILRSRDYENVDGLVTGEEGVALVTYYADCVPLFFVDPIHRAIGLAHSGWRGTVGRMGECMVKTMGREFSAKPEELRAAVGPSICRTCYEVSEEVARQFTDMLGEEVVSPGRAPGKYQLDLWRANELILLQAGIMAEHIAVTDICTCHNPDYLFSHRASGGRRGNLGAFLMLKPR